MKRIYLFCLTKHIFFFSFCVALSTLLFTTMTEAEEERDLYSLEEVVVTATRTERSVESLPASVSVITREDIQNSAAHRVDDLLRELPGVYVRSYHGILSSSTTNDVSMRGLPGEDSVLVMRDGIPINDPYGGAVEWNEVDIKDIERIEIVRGTGSALYGSNAMGGVINIITKRPAKEMRSSAEIGYGSMNTRLLSLGNSATSGKFGYQLSGNYLDSDGYCDVVEEKRKSYHSDKSVERYSLNGKVSYEIDPSSSMLFSSSVYDQEDSGRYNIKGYEVADEKNRFSLNYQKKGDNWALKTDVYKHDDDSHYTSPYYDSTAKTYNAISYISYNEQDTLGATIQLSMDLTKNNTLTLGTDYKQGDIDRHDDYLTSDHDIKVEGKQEYTALFLQDEISIGEKLSVILGGRYDWWKSFDGYGYDNETTEVETYYPEKSDQSFNPKVGANYHLFDNTTIKGSVGTAFKAPTLSNLYRTFMGTGSTYRSNPDLDPEELISYEAGIDQYIGDKLMLTATLYETRAQDFVYSVYTETIENQKYYDKINVGEVRVRGVEIGADFMVNHEWSLFANATFNSSKVTEFENDPELEGKYLSHTPTENYLFGINYSNPKIITAKLTGRYVGKRYNDDKNTTELESYFTTDLKLSRQLWEHVTASLSMTNINNVKFEEADGYESPGIMVMGAVKVEF